MSERVTKSAPQKASGAGGWWDGANVETGNGISVIPGSRSEAAPVHIDPREVGGALADLGTMLPIVGALVVTNGLDPVAAFTLVGATYLAAGLWFRMPMPVQPIKAAAAIAVATGVSAGVVSAAGLVLGGILVVLGISGAGRWLLRIFPLPIIRGNQLGVGVLLMLAASALLASDGASAVTVGVAVAVGAALLLGGEGRVPAAILILGAGVAFSVAAGGLERLPALSPAFPRLSVPGLRDAGVALVLLVIPQIPLTLSNAVVGTSQLAGQYFGERATRVTPDGLCLSAGVANVGAGLLGGIPMCHGSSGLTAHYRMGARTAGMNVVAGVLFLSLGLLAGRSAGALLALIPTPVLAGMLAYTGLRHALLVTDRRGTELGIALAMGLVGALTRNLMLGLMVGLPLYLAFVALPRRFALRAAQP
jgi:sulfate permease, SulP family